MKRFFKIVLLSFMTVFLLSGCEDIGDSTADGSIETASESGTSGESKKPELPEVDMTFDDGTEHIFDDAGVFTSGVDLSEIRNSAALISKTFMINIAVVTTDDIGDSSASEYASEYYKKLYGGSNGIMFLINNDTGNDYILRKGAPSLFISDSDVEMLFTELSPLLVTEKYAEASEQVFGMIWDKLPKFAVDRTNKLTMEEITAADSVLSAASGEDRILSMIFIGDIGSKTIEDYAKEQSEKYMNDSNDSRAIMVLNTQTAEYYICGQGEFADAERNQEVLKKQIAACFTGTGDKKSFDCQNAAEVFVKFMSK